MLLVLPPHHAAAEAAQRARLLSWETRLPPLGAAAQRGALWPWVGLLLLLLQLLLGMLRPVLPLLRGFQGRARRALGGPGHRGRLRRGLLLPATTATPDHRRRSCWWMLRIRLLRWLVPLLLQGPGTCASGCLIIAVSFPGQIHHWLISCCRG